MLSKADLQRLRSLREKKHREAEGVFVVEGDKVVTELLAAGTRFTEIYATPAWTAAPGTCAGKPVITQVSEAEMARISHFPTASPVLAVGPIPRRQLGTDELNSGLTLALDGVQDPGNVGTLLRIADWFGLNRVLLSLDCADLFHQKVINASMGSFARIAAYRVDLPAALASVAALVPVLGCDLAGTSIHETAPVSDAIIVIGSEGRGLSPAVAARITQRITIPRRGGAESLNAAVAAGIVCAQLRRA